MNKKAFTLVELIIVIVLVGIIAVYVAPKITTSGFQDSADVDSFISNIRFTQHKSMVTGGGWKITFDVANNEYVIYDRTGSPATLPADKNPVEVKSGLSSVKDEDGTDITDIYFDFFGTPALNQSCTNLLTKKVYVKISSYTIVVEPNSGGIYVQ